MQSLPFDSDALDANFRSAYLIAGFIQENLSLEEEQELDQWVQQDDNNMDLFEKLTDPQTSETFLSWYFNQNVESRLTSIKKKLQFEDDSTVKRFSFFQYAAAAIVLMAIGTGIYFMAKSKNNPPEKPLVAKNQITPGHPFAVLDIGDGKKIVLSGRGDTTVSPDIQVTNDHVIYAGTDVAIQQHTLTVPRKAFYQITLPDGSNVWLNSESSIQYPSRFTGNERRVIVTGETYFEVAKDAEHPFIVVVNNTEITALGTAFNVNAYPNEGVLRATLAEGSIKVVSGNAQHILSPGQQIRIKDRSAEISNADVALCSAWTRNEFKFKNTNIEEIMRLVERWYDATIIYEGKVNSHFTATISRDAPVTEFLEILQKTGEVNFKIDSNRIKVYP